ncbi:RagB/SusD family nutrient uptake outer membrane protein [Parapedobacter sp. ISTM3]|uniref:RagB/SusD family nutrient uptake outer membrane protein n=1 Tax=Parapedobacter sp. ISTM3 TaxID=2800130 RepID=UPI0019059877|nr:RagB/SusD family nutrient uptake outer membrane protein [Parapedobacter sp. ISTM3]MBK1442025.1 RagB/SusD family nutrient uptake outer membrane protein [Parapedobacter sp. ISTM3]
MKRNYRSLLLIALAPVVLLTSCVKDLLDRQPTTELGESAFWQNLDDAEYALMGLYSSVRPLFDRDYYLDGHGEYVRARGTSATSGNLRLGDAYHGANYNPTGYAGSFDKMYRYLYGGVNRANYVIENAEKMAASNPNLAADLDAIIGEAKLLRGMVYFRLISMWGDVPYIGRIVNGNAEVANIERMPIAQVKDSILADFTDAFERLPDSPPAMGRAAKPAALAFRGKLNLYWACWNKNGWPELDTFTPHASEATEAFTAAAEDFRSVIQDYGLMLFRGGEPGDIDTLGRAEILPNYYYLFTPVANGDPEIIMGFTHGGIGTNQGEELMRDVAGRSHEGSQCWVSPRYEIADRYQSIITGDFVDPLIPMNPSNPDARTTPGSAVNPQSYENRDYRMKASIMWDYEMSVGMVNRQSTGWVPFIYQTWAQPITIGGETYISYNTDGTNSGYVFRKFLRNEAGLGRSEGDYHFPVMRLADVYLMYAEATNELSGPTADAIDMVNKIRHRGNLPPLNGEKTASKEAFFDAIEQERIVELLGEGHRGFDLRRWRAIERVWGEPYGPGVWRRDTHGANQQRYYQNTPEREYERNYIFRIPESERDRNPNLTQNTPWL